LFCGCGCSYISWGGTEEEEKGRSYRVRLIDWESRERERGKEVNKQHYNMAQQPLRLGIAVQNQPQGPVVGVSKASVAAALAAQPKAPQWGADVLGKAEKMKKKTKEVHDCFKLPESEFSIQGMCGD